MARRTARRRRSRRFTPRRWLPFVALTALVVGAVMVSSEEPSKPPATTDPVLDTSRLPSITATDAIATSWYCGGGTATGDGAAELSVLLANDDRNGAVAEVTFLGAVGQEATTEVDVPAHGRARVRASEHLEADWVGAIVEIRGGRVGVDREVLGPLGFDAASCSVVASDHWFVPSGSTLRGADETLTVFNPFPDAASVSISFATDTGPRTPRSLRALSIPGRSVRTVDLGDIITNRAAIATTVRARSGRVVVDRVQTYDGQGDPLTAVEGANAPEGLVSTPAIPVRAPRWIFPGARVSTGVTTQVAVYNPGSETAEVDVALNYQEPKRNPEVEPIALTIRPREQAVVTLDDVPGILPDQDLWVDVRSLDGVPVVAERLSFFGEPSLRTGAAVSAGSPVAATRWMVTQGGPTSARSATVQIINPGDSSARITVLTLSDGDRDELESASVSVPAGDRRSLDLGAAGPAATVIVASSKPVVVSSSLAMIEGTGLAVQPALPYPETVVALPPVS
ncbi:MAG: hypothetical protein JWO77_2231 [Ilumatobacteraceae bacterium]|nr:hypothetical protein [Ilumatobacteraceae bacterium]